MIIFNEIKTTLLAPRALAIGALMLTSCQGNIGATESSEVSPDTGVTSDAGAPEPPPGQNCDVATIFENNGCTSCHDATPGITGGGLDLLSEGLSERLLNRPSVNPSCADDLVVDGTSPEASLLLRVISPQSYGNNGTQTCTAPRMPLGSDQMLSAEDVACIDRWVTSVAAVAPAKEPVPFAPAPAEAAVGKIKYLLHGEAITNEELAAVRNAQTNEIDPEAVRTLIDSWMWQSPGVLTTAFNTKLRLFLFLSLQQRKLGGTPTFQFQSQLNLRPKLPEPWLDRQAFVDSVPPSFVDTARDLVAAQEDFRKVVTTRRWRVTTAILAALVYADTLLFDDRGRLAHEDRFVMFHHLNEEDYRDWRYVTLEQATEQAPPELSYENTPAFANSVRGIAADGTLRLWAPRVGFFNTIVFLDQWESNVDNQFRISVSQILATALDLIFETGDPTEPVSLKGLDEAHAGEDQACFSCHKMLDPIRTIFQRYYTYGGRSLGERRGEAATFAFQGHVVPTIDTMDDLAQAVATHPRFAAAWTQKLCMWANSKRCLESDPEFTRITERFRTGYDAEDPRDDFRLTTLIRELFSSSLIMGHRSSANHQQNEFIVSATRYEHFCHAMNVRIQQASEQSCAENNIPPDRCSAPRRNCFGNWSKGQALGGDDYTRGIREFTTPTSQDPVYVVAAREACRELARSATGDSSAFPRGGAPEPSIARMVQALMGLPTTHPRHDAAVDALLRTHQILRTSGACPEGTDYISANRDVPTGGDFVCGPGINRSQAMQQVFVIACTSPDTIGLGL